MDRREYQAERRGLFNLSFGPTGSKIWVGPAWAVLCGTVASGALSRDWRSVVSVLLAVIVADPILCTICTLTADGYRPVADTTGNPGHAHRFPSLPYTLPGSVAARLQGYLGERLASSPWAVRPRTRRRLVTAGFASALAILIAASLGSLPVALVVAALGMIAGRLIVQDRSEVLNRVLDSFVLAAATWLLGYVALANPLVGERGLSSLGLATLWAVTYAGVFHGCVLISAQRLSSGANVLALFQIIMVAVLILAKSPILGGAVTLFVLPQVMLQPAMLRLGDGGWYLRRVQGFAMLATMTMAVAMTT